MAYSIRLYDLAGNLVASPAPFASATARWDLDGPGSLEVTLREAQAGGWVPGQRRVELLHGANLVWGGWLLGLEASWEAGRGVGYAARCLGHAAPLERRFVLADLVYQVTPSTTIAWNLIQHAQSQPNGNLGISLGTVSGSPPTLTRRYCAPRNILEAIEELASRDPGGFDWEIDAARRFNAWVGGRGTDRSATVSFSPSQARETRISWDGSELHTYATAVPPEEGPCAPAPVTRASSLATTYVRQDVVVDAESSDASELAALADHELAISGRARLRLEVVYEETHAPQIHSLELGDQAMAQLPAVFGGSVKVRLISRQVSLEDRGVHFWTLELEAV